MKALPLIIIASIILGFIGLAYGAWYLNQRKSKRRAFIENYPFPAVLRSKLLFKHPDLSENQVFHVFEGLRQFFLICLQANAVGKKRSFGMPSKIVDDAWHDFILMSREYSRFCDQAFGGYLHHTPAGASDEAPDKGLMRTLHQLKSSRPGVATWATLGGIPLLFALDKALAVEGGQHYTAEALEELERKRLAWLNNGGDVSIELGGLESSCSSGDSGGGDGGGGCGGGCGS
jgi:hypothetical protein